MIQAQIIADSINSATGDRTGENVKLVWITPDAEKLIAKIARVSNPNNQDNPNISKLLQYCIGKKHWSIFQMANMCLEINTSRVVSAQFIRHQSMQIQEFSQRYANVQSIEPINLREQDFKNRQNSTDTLSPEIKTELESRLEDYLTNGQALYQEMIAHGVAKESARMILPMASTTRLYANNTIRGWIHYLQVRADKESGTQLEHYEIATKCKEIFISELPIISEALGWKNG